MAAAAVKSLVSGPTRLAGGDLLDLFSRIAQPQPPYLHVLPGRVRIRVAAARRAPETARRIEDSLQRLAGVTSAAANPVTGSVLVQFDERALGAADVVERIRELGVLPAPIPGSSALRAAAPARCPSCGSALAAGPRGPTPCEVARSAARGFASDALGALAVQLAQLALRRALLALL